MLERTYVPWKATYIRSPNGIRVIRGVQEWLDTPGVGTLWVGEITVGSR
jgi:hypothetical protein